MYSPKYLHDRLHAAKTDMARTLLYELQPALVCGNRATVELIILAPVPITLLTLQMHAGTHKLNCIQPAHVRTGIYLSAYCILVSANSVGHDHRQSVWTDQLARTQLYCSQNQQQLTVLEFLPIAFAFHAEKVPAGSV